MTRIQAVLAVQKFMPSRSLNALAHFCETNPHYRGAQWADVLDVLLSSDAHCDLTEAIYEDLKIIVPIGTMELIIPVFLTLLYHNKGHAPFAGEVAYYHGFVQGNWQRDVEEALKQTT